jgi:nitrous oxidase accessory protein NosD
VGANNKIDHKRITLGRDFGSEVEVISGLQGGESVVINPPDSVVAGEEVRISQAKQGAQNGAAE